MAESNKSRGGNSGSRGGNRSGNSGSGNSGGRSGSGTPGRSNTSSTPGKSKRLLEEDEQREISRKGNESGKRSGSGSDLNRSGRTERSDFDMDEE